MENTSFRESTEIGFQFLGIKFAPLFIPFHRRWETFCLACVMSFGVIFIVISPFTVYGLYCYSPWLLLLYICWMIYDWNTPLTGGRKIVYSRKIFTGMPSYFPSKIVKTIDIKAGRNYLFASFPHGVISAGMVSNFIVDVNCRQAFPELDIRVIMLKAFFAFPFTREFLLSGGASASTEDNITGLLRHKDKNKVVILMVGGAREALYANPGKKHTVILENRRGFIRVALKTGSPIVPVYTFGENDAYDQIQTEKWMKFQNFVRKWTGIPPLIINGRGLFQYTFGLLPHRTPITTVVGKPIVVPLIDNPTREDLDKYHMIFKKELIDLFDSNKEKYDRYGNKAELTIL